MHVAPRAASRGEAVGGQEAVSQKKRGFDPVGVGCDRVFGYDYRSRWRNRFLPVQGGGDLTAA
jgi:hypothetical protein